MKSNSAILYFFSIPTPEANTEKVVFCISREVNESIPKNDVWFNKGTLLHSFSTNSKEVIRGWSLLQSKENSEKMVAALKSGFTIQNAAGDETTLLLPPSLVLTNDDSLNMYTIGDVSPLSASYRTTQYSCKEWEKEIGCLQPDILSEPLCNALSGYKSIIKIIDQMLPTGFLGEGKLYKYLQDRICLVNERQGYEIALRGYPFDPGSPGVDGFEGYIYNLPTEKKSVRLEIIDTENDSSSEVEIKLNNGVGGWNVEHPNFSGKGITKLYDFNGTLIGAEKFFLLMKIQTSFQMMNIQTNDLYERNLSFSDQASVIAPEHISWKPEYKSHPQLLSDEISKIFRTIGKKIIIQDPYFLGDFISVPGEKIGIRGMSEGAKCYLNALILACLIEKKEELFIILDAKKLKLTNEEKKYSFIKKYRDLFSSLGKHRPTKIYLGFVKTVIHDRYILGSETGTLYKASQSANGLLKTSDFSIEVDKSAEKLNKTSRILRQMNDSEKVQIHG